VPHRLPAGDVKGVGERADDLGQAEVHVEVIGIVALGPNRPIALVAWDPCRL
jgi:hypothetical protein